MFEQLNLFDIMQEGVPDCDVEIKGAVNMKSTPISHYEVSMAYGDLTLIISILHDYVKGFDKLTERGECPINQIEYEAYYRKKFLEIADKLANQIDYDYEAKLKKCLKKYEKMSKSDIGEDALILALKKS